VAGQVFRWIALAGFPASLTSPGATLSFSLVGAYGLYVIAVRKDLPADLRAVFRLMIACYLFLLAVDFLNGGGWSNLSTTGVNYLPLIAIVPFAHALRTLRIGPDILDRAMQLTVLLALANTLIRILAFGEDRPGGPNLNSIPYAFILAVWCVFLFSRGLGTGRKDLLLASAAALIPILLAASKNASACLLAGLLVVAAGKAIRHAHRRQFLISLVAGALALAASLYLTISVRIHSMVSEIRVLYESGSVTENSFGYRFELAQAGWRAFLEDPFMGHGLAQYMSVVRNHAMAGAPDLAQFGHVHNDYIAHMVAFGVFGLAFLAAFLVGSLWTVARSGDVAYRRAGFAFVAMLAIYMGADIAFNMDPITACMVLALGAVLSAPQQRGQSSAAD